MPFFYVSHLIICTVLFWIPHFDLFKSSEIYDLSFDLKSSDLSSDPINIMIFNKFLRFKLGDMF
ncbi:hypothetical protein Hanom_Chr07g00674091 [Helianthus anomalus]